MTTAARMRLVRCREGCAGWRGEGLAGGVIDGASKLVGTGGRGPGAERPTVGLQMSEYSQGPPLGA
jgi:hypothetical protein